LLALREGVAQLAHGDFLWEGITSFDPTKIGNHPSRMIAIIAGLRSKKFDASLNFFPSNTWQYHLLPRLAGIKRRYGFRYHVSPWSKLPWLCNRKLAVDETLHDVHQNLALIGFYLQKDIDRTTPEFPVLFSEEDKLWAKRELTALSPNGVRIGIHPGSSAEHGMDAKRWSPSKFGQLADLVCQALKGEAYIFGGPGEGDLQHGVASAMKTKVHLAPAASLPRTAAMLFQCTLCICNDSGLMHIAACGGTPTAGIFGPTDQRRNGPFGASTIVISKPMEGFPVWTAKSVGNRSLPKGIDPAASLKALSAEEAWAQLRPWIEHTLNSSIASKPQ
jgi:heptosyltransferase-2